MKYHKPVVFVILFIKEVYSNNKRSTSKDLIVIC